MRSPTGILLILIVAFFANHAFPEEKLTIQYPKGASEEEKRKIERAWILKNLDSDSPEIQAMAARGTLYIDPDEQIYKKMLFLYPPTSDMKNLDEWSSKYWQTVSWIEKALVKNAKKVLPLVDMKSLKKSVLTYDVCEDIPYDLARFLEGTDDPSAKEILKTLRAKQKNCSAPK